MRLFILLAAALAASPMAVAAQPAAAPMAAVAATDAGDEIVCRKVKETGSLVKSRKTCHSRSEWNKLDEAHQRASRQLVQDNTSRVNGQ